MLRRTGRPGPRSRVGGLVVVAILVVAACGATSTGSPTPLLSPSPTASQRPAASTPAEVPPRSPAGSPAPSASPRCCTPAATAASFWAAVSRGLTAARHLQVTASGPNPAVLRFQPSASASLAGGTIVFVCVDGAAYDGQSAFARVPGTWTCGGGALVSGFRQIGQPADSWNATSPTDASIREAVTAAADGTWAWTYSAISPFLGGKVATTVRFDPVRGRIVSARRVDPIGVTTYAFDYGQAFPTIAVPGH